MLLNALSRTGRAGLTQLYFDRQRVLAEALSLPPGDPGRAALALRASELAARLDGWSGGGGWSVRNGPWRYRPLEFRLAPDEGSWPQWWFRDDDGVTAGDGSESSVGEEA